MDQCVNVRLIYYFNTYFDNLTLCSPVVAVAVIHWRRPATPPSVGRTRPPEHMVRSRSWRARTISPCLPSFSLGCMLRNLLIGFYTRSLCVNIYIFFYLINFFCSSSKSRISSRLRLFPRSVKTHIKPVILLFRLSAIRSVFALSVFVCFAKQNISTIFRTDFKTRAERTKNKKSHRKREWKKILTFTRSPNRFFSLHSPSPSNATSRYRNNGYNRRCRRVHKRLWRLGEKNVVHHLPPRRATATGSNKLIFNASAGVPVAVGLWIFMVIKKTFRNFNDSIIDVQQCAYVSILSSRL